MSLGLDLFFKEVLTSRTRPTAANAMCGIKVSSAAKDGVGSEATTRWSTNACRMTPTLMACIRQMPDPTCPRPPSSRPCSTAQWVSTVGIDAHLFIDATIPEPA